MPNHLSDETLIDVLEETAGGEVRRHLAECRWCEARVRDAEEGQRLAASAEVPEPSPLYWEHFRRQVGRRLEIPEPRRWPGMVWGPVLAAAAAVVMALWVPGTPPGAGPTPASVLPAWSALPPAENDEGLAVLEAIAPQAGDALGVATDCRGVGSCLAELSDQESRALAAAWRDQLERGGRS